MNIPSALITLTLTQPQAEPAACQLIQLGKTDPQLRGHWPGDRIEGTQNEATNQNQVLCAINIFAHLPVKFVKQQMRNAGNANEV